MTPILVLTMEILSKVYILLFSYKHNLLIFNNISHAKFSDVIFKGYINKKFPKYVTVLRLAVFSMLRVICAPFLLVLLSIFS